MADMRNATPLIALDAIVIDTETTGLDPAKARVVEIAAVCLIAGRLDEKSGLRCFVNPGEPIPASATAIHGIDDSKVADAGSFAENWPKFSTHVANAVVIGHTLSFDLAVLKRECVRSGIIWHPLRSLDTRLLAQVVEPDLAGYSLESLAAWLDVEIVGRHSALGDALTTAHIFRALVPRLREGGIRTLAEAMTACTTLVNVLDRQHRAGWIEPIMESSRVDVERTLSRIDSYPYRHRIGVVMRSPPKFTPPDTLLGAAITRMTGERVSSLFVQSVGGSEPHPRSVDTGIITERDALRALTELGAKALDQRVDRFMSKPLSAIPVDAFIYRAIGRMNRLKIRHLGVTDESGRVVGALTARELLRSRAGDAILLGDEIDQARDVHDLALVWAKLHHVAESLLAEGIGGRDIAEVISRELGALTRQAAVIAEIRMIDDNEGRPPCPYAMTVLGSAGRGESLLAMDQDNALVFAEGEPGGVADRWFEKLAVYINDILHEVGVPYCKGGVMAKMPDWRGSAATWHQRISSWIRHSNPKDLLSVDIFFDMRSVHGDGGLVSAVWRGAFDIARGEVAFAKLLAESAGSVEPGFGLFGGFKTDRGRIDLKKAGLFGIVTTARALAICHHIVERSTPGRIAGIKTLGIGAENDLDALFEAQGVFLDLLVAQQIRDIAQGITPSNRVEIKVLSPQDQSRLRKALHAVEQLDRLTQELLFTA